jgi:phospholipase/carboxylesterase
MATEGQADLGFVHRFVPAPEQDNAPTLLLLHGTGGDENDLLALGRMLDPHAALLSPRGKVLENSMPRFFRRHAEGVLDREDLVRRTHELADFVAAASAAYHFSPNHVIAAGFSNGANIAASMLLLRPQVLAAAILSHPMLPLIPESLPDLSGRRVFIGAGMMDPLVPAAQSEQLAQMLRQAGAEVSMRWYNVGHALGHEEVRDARAWLSEER